LKPREYQLLRARHNDFGVICRDLHTALSQDRDGDASFELDKKMPPDRVMAKGLIGMAEGISAHFI
jgi:hypothetical protein